VLVAVLHDKGFDAARLHAEAKPRQLVIPPDAIGAVWLGGLDVADSELRHGPPQITVSRSTITAHGSNGLPGHCYFHAPPAAHESGHWGCSYS